MESPIIFIPLMSYNNILPQSNILDRKRFKKLKAAATDLPTDCLLFTKLKYIITTKTMKHSHVIRAGRQGVTTYGLGRRSVRFKKRASIHFSYENINHTSHISFIYTFQSEKYDVFL